MLNDVLRKLTSRKFVAAISAFILGVGMILNGTTDAETIGGTAIALGTIIAYIFGEAKVDAAKATATGTAAASAAAATAPASATQATTAAIDTAKGLTDPKVVKGPDA